MPTTPDCWERCSVFAASRGTRLTSENLSLQGKLTRGDHFRDSGVSIPDFPQELGIPDSQFPLETTLAKISLAPIHSLLPYRIWHLNIFLSFGKPLQSPSRNRQKSIAPARQHFAKVNENTICSAPIIFLRMSVPCADGYGRPPSPQVDRIEVRPHLCTGRAGATLRTRGSAGQARETRW